jgi:hypothetical protein
MVRRPGGNEITPQTLIKGNGCSRENVTAVFFMRTQSLVIYHLHFSFAHLGGRANYRDSRSGIPHLQSALEVRANDK